MAILDTFRAKAQRGDLASFAFFLLTGLLLTWLAITESLVFLVLVAAAALIGLGWWALVRARNVDLELWQWILLAALSGYMLLNYGFENLAIHIGGLPFIVSYAMMYGCLALAIHRHPSLWLKAAKDPGMIFLFILMLQVGLHLIVDLPKYGLWAIRDSTMVLDGLFVTLGLLWAMKRSNLLIFMKWLLAFLVVNLFYSYTLPWGEGIQGVSPKSGVFNEVALVGNYRGNVIFLMIGALFCLLLAQYVVRWPRWILMLLTVGQIFGLAIEQARAMYVSLVLSLIILALAGRAKESLRLTFILLLALLPVLFLTVSGIKIEGRVGEVNMDFLAEHMRSITGARNTPGSTNEGRMDWYEQAWRKYQDHPWVGVGFGQPLLDVDENQTGAAIRMPHNASLSILVRLGVVGLVFWVMFHLYILATFLYAYRQRKRYDPQTQATVLWLFLVYVVFIVEISVEAGLEFPSGAVPFYFLMGLTIGLIRYQFSQRRIAGQGQTA